MAKTLEEQLEEQIEETNSLADEVNSLKNQLFRLGVLGSAIVLVFGIFGYESWQSIPDKINRRQQAKIRRCTETIPVIPIRSDSEHQIQLSKGR